MAVLHGRDGGALGEAEWQECMGCRREGRRKNGWGEGGELGAEEGGGEGGGYWVGVEEVGYDLGEAREDGVGWVAVDSEETGRYSLVGRDIVAWIASGAGMRSRLRVAEVLITIVGLRVGYSHLALHKRSSA